MKRYDLQEGDGVHVAGAPNLMLVMDGGRLVLPDFGVSTVRLEFYWRRDEPYPVAHDERGFHVEVDEATWDELRGSAPPA